MSTVPYIFADDYGNIPLSYLDANFANVKANVDYATSAGSAYTALTATTATTATTANTALTATTATTANTALTATTASSVTTNAQPNITSVGTLISLGVTGNITGGNISTGILSATGNITGGNISTGILSATGNTSLGNITISNRLINNGLEIVSADVFVITANAQTSNLNPTTTYNIFFPNAAGYTHTINMPAGPVNGQLTKFSITGNSMTLVEGTGTLNIGFSGLANIGTSYVYMYRTTGNIWVKTA